MHTLRDTTEGLAALIPPALIGSQARQRLLRVAADIPSTVATAWGFECRLDDDERVDFLYCVTPQDGLDLAVCEPALADFARAWPACVPHVWVEHDVTGGLPLAPSIFYHLTPRATDADIASLVPQARTARLRPLLQGSAVLDQVGRMDGRAGAPARYVVTCAARDATDIVRSFGAALDFEAFERTAAWLDTACDHVALDLEDDASGAGIEAHFQKRRQPRDEPRWAALLDRLVEDGRCRADKRDALLQLPRVSADPSIWGTACILILSHLKISLPGGAVKAYLGFLRVRL